MINFYSEKRVVITGGAGGIGRAVGGVFLSKGADVTLVDLTTDGLKAAADELGPYGDVDIVVSDLNYAGRLRQSVGRSRSSSLCVDPLCGDI